jgi:sulfatase maturation enzyme AslB (radical SAM superfamily)
MDKKLPNAEIRFEVTNRCNASCIMCPREKMTRPQGVMSTELYKRVLDEAVEAGAGIVSLEHYGEPFLDPEVFDKARYAKSRGLKVYTISNGSLLDDKKIDGVIEHFDKIRISMYGITKQTYESIHKGLVFEQVEANVEKLFEERRRRGSSLKIEIYLLVMKENEHEKDIIKERYEKLADAFSIWTPHNWGNGRNYRPVSDNKKTCGRPFNGPLQVQWNGLVVACVFDYNNFIVLGDLTRQSVAEVIDGEPYNALRRAHLENNFTDFPFCNVCEQTTNREDVLLYTNIASAKVGATNTAYIELKRN